MRTSWIFMYLQFGEMWGHCGYLGYLWGFMHHWFYVLLVKYLMGYACTIGFGFVWYCVLCVVFNTECTGDFWCGSLCFVYLWKTSSCAGHYVGLIYSQLGELLGKLFPYTCMWWTLCRCLLWQQRALVVTFAGVLLCPELSVARLLCGTLLTVYCTVQCIN